MNALGKNLGSLVFLLGVCCGGRVYNNESSPDSNYRRVFCWHFYRHWVPNSTELTVWEPVLYYWQALPLSTWVWDGSDYLHLILKNRLLKMWRCVWRRIWSLSPPELSEKWLKSHHTAGSHLPRTTKFECWGTFRPNLALSCEIGQEAGHI